MDSVNGFNSLKYYQPNISKVYRVCSLQTFAKFPPRLKPPPKNISQVFSYTKLHHVQEKLDINFGRTKVLAAYNKL